MFSVEDIMHLINEVEERFPVDKWVIDDIHVWPIMRFNLHFALLPHTYKSGAPEKVNNREINYFLSKPLRIFKNFAEFVCAYLMDYKVNNGLNISAGVVLLSDGFSYSRLKGVWYENFCDPFITYFRKKNISSLLMTPTYQYFIPTYSRAMFILPHLAYITFIKNVFSKEANLPQENLSDFEKLNDFLKTHSVNSVSFDLTKIRKKVRRIRACADFYKEIFKKIKPRLALMVEYYRTQGMAFSLACREFGIPCVDIQHGFQVDSHVAYGRWNKVPESGYELLPAIFWCWSNYEVSIIEKWSKNISRWHKPIVGGNLLFKIWQDDNNDFVKYYDRKITEIEERYPGFLHILFTLNGDTESELKTLLSIIEKAQDSRLPYYFWIRLHPCRLNNKRKIKNILSKHEFLNIEFDKATDFPLYALLRHMDLHITEFSSTVIEAEAFGVPSIIVHPLGSGVFKEQILSGWALPVYDLDQILPAIQTQQKKRKLLIQTQLNKVASDAKGTDILLDLINKKIT